MIYKNNGGKAMSKLPEWAQEILGRALVDVKSKESAEKVKEILSRTALGTDKKYMKIATDLIDMKVKNLRLPEVDP